MAMTKVCDVCGLPTTDVGCSYCSDAPVVAMKLPPYAIELVGDGGPWIPTGIDVDALHRAASQVEILVSAEELRLLAIATRDAARARERAVLDARWTRWKDRT